MYYEKPREYEEFEDICDVRGFEQAEDKTRALVLLQKAFNHSSQEVTLHYLGLLDEDIQDMYENVNIGYDFI